MGKMFKIALVDDHVLLRNALGEVIDRFADCRVTLLARHGKELFDKLVEDDLPDLVILDIDMPEMDGYETAKLMQTRYPSVPILILSMYISELPMIRLLQSGVRGFLKKDIHPGELRNAIMTTIQTGYYYLGNMAGKLVNLLKNGESNSPRINTMSLTEIELSFLIHASTDMTYKEIAQVMKINPRTIENYRDSLFVKLNVKSRVGLVLYAIRSGIVRIGVK